MGSTSSLPLLPHPLQLGVVAPDKGPTMGRIELFDHLNSVQTNDLYQSESLEIELFNHLTVCVKRLLVIVSYSSTWNNKTVYKRMSHVK